MAKRKNGKMNANRLFKAIARIGYEPASAILDIVDNSVSAGSSEIGIDFILEKIEEKGKGTKTVISEILISDNGSGMDESLLDNALVLGSDDANYIEGTLSKFGMGLKSASSSLGNCLRIISKSKKTGLLFAEVDQESFTDGDYSYELGEATKNDEDLFNEYVNEKSGTIIKISKLHLDSLPSYKDILNKLNEEVGVIYYYALVRDKNKINIKLNGESFAPVDPLFRSEVDLTDPNLDEKNWDGISVKWIAKEKPVQLDTKNKLKGILSLVQLPHPPSFKEKGLGTQADCRRKYFISAQNYGVYIYRNGRLVSWADSMDGIITRDQDLYSFRGVLNIDSDADDLLNIDVTKSRIVLSEIAKEQVRAIVSEGKKQSIEAWNEAKRWVSDNQRTNPEEKVNELLDNISNELQEEEEIEDQMSSSEEKEKNKERKKSISSRSGLSEEEKKSVKTHGQRIIYVETLPNNQLWVRGYDAEEGVVVKINKGHRFIRHVFNEFSGDASVVKIMGLFFFALARGEYKFVYKTDIDDVEADLIMTDFRERVGGEISDIIKLATESDNKFFKDED